MSKRVDDAIQPFGRYRRNRRDKPIERFAADFKEPLGAVERIEHFSFQAVRLHTGPQRLA